MKKKLPLKDIKRLAKMIKITELPYGFLKAIGNMKKINLDEFSHEEKELFVHMALILEQAQKRKKWLDKRESIKAIQKFLIDCALEFGVRKGWLKRDRKWTLKNRDDVEYDTTKKGEKEFEDMMAKTEKKKVDYIK